MKAIALTNGGEALVDDADYETLCRHSWRRGSKGYAEREVRINGKRVTVLMHREVAGCVKGDGLQVDHDNRQRLDNRRFNLRVCGYTGNARNSGMRHTNRSGYKGVHLQKKRAPNHADRWVAQIVVDSRKVHLGCFDTATLAHEFYCLAADMLHGEFSNHG